jgi:outer membrane protein assembly factor BamB
LLLILTISVAGCSSSSDERGESAPAKKSTAPPAPSDEYTRFQSPYADVDQQNTRDAHSALRAANVAKLEEAWSRPIEGAGEGEGFVASPIVTDDIVFVQDLDSNVAALNLLDGRPYWEKRFDLPAPPPGGLTVSRGFQILAGATPTEAFGLEERTGKEAWSVPLARKGSGVAVGMAPGYYNGLVFVAARPEGKVGGDRGVLLALDVRSGGEAWRFSTGLGVGSPAFDRKGALYLGSGGLLVKLDEATGKPDWRYRLTPAAQGSDVWDPVVAMLGARKVVIAADRAGTVVAVERKRGEPLWRRSLGSRGETEVTGPIAVRDATAFVPVGNHGVKEGGELTALDLSTGSVKWRKRFPAPLVGPVLATNDVVFAVSVDGGVYALNAKSGRKLWSEKASSAAEGGLAVAGNTLLVRTGAPKWTRVRSWLPTAFLSGAAVSRRGALRRRPR